MATKKREAGSEKRVGASKRAKSVDVEPQAKPHENKPRTARYASLTDSPSSPNPDYPVKARKAPEVSEELPPVESLKRATDARDLERAIQGGYVALRAYIQLRAARAVNLVFEATEIGLASGAMSPGTVGGAKLILEHALTEPLDVKLGKPSDTQRKLVDRVQALSAIEAQLARESDATH